MNVTDIGQFRGEVAGGAWRGVPDPSQAQIPPTSAARAQSRETSSTEHETNLLFDPSLLLREESRPLTPLPFPSITLSMLLFSRRAAPSRGAQCGRFFLFLRKMRLWFSQ